MSTSLRMLRLGLRLMSGRPEVAVEGELGVEDGEPTGYHSFHEGWNFDMLDSVVGFVLEFFLRWAGHGDLWRGSRLKCRKLVLKFGSSSTVTLHCFH